MTTRRQRRSTRGAEISIRPMLPTDLEAVVDLDARVFGERRPAYFERRLAALGRTDVVGQGIGLVAEDSGRVVGLVMGTLAYGEFGFAQITALVDSIAVHPEHQRRGIGRQLSAAFIAEAGLRDAREVYTLVSWNAWDMLRFFDSLGFSLAGTVPLRMAVTGQETA